MYPNCHLQQILLQIFYVLLLNRASGYTASDGFISFPLFWNERCHGSHLVQTCTLLFITIEYHDTFWSCSHLVQTYSTLHYHRMPEKRSCILHGSKSWTTDDYKRPLVLWYYILCNVVLGIAYCGITYCGILYCILWLVAGLAWLMFASVRKRSPRAKYTTIHSRVEYTLGHAP